MILSKRLVSKYYPYLVGGCLIVKNGKILLVKEGIIEKGKWNQPAGWLDKGEHPVKGAKREAEEETGLRIKITNLLGIYSLIKERSISKPGSEPIEAHGLKLIFIGKIVGGKIKVDKKEIIDARFFEPKEILKMSNKELRDLDIKEEVKDYLAGKKYPLSIISHINYKVRY